jgi:hypothetical protein
MKRVLVAALAACGHGPGDVTVELGEMIIQER